MILGILQARTSSTRLPGKVLAPILGEPMLARQVERIRRATTLDGLVLATSTDPSDDVLVDLAESLSLPVYRGPLDDVLARYVGAAREFDADVVVRLTADCPLASPAAIDETVTAFLSGSYDYASNRAHCPDGQDVEVVTTPALEWMTRCADPEEREHVTLGIYRRGKLFSLLSTTGPDLTGLRWTVDTADDLAFVRSVYADLYPTKPDFDTDDILATLALRYARSAAHLTRAEAVIPLGAQTFSKSRTQYPPGAAPLYAERASGSRLWDIDGNQYVDLVGALGCVALGYADPGVDAAVAAQLRRGVSFSLSSTLEAEVAELLVDLIPCAEMVRFAKNGTDVTSAAVRLARAFTGRDHVILTGYHGWADWSIGTTTMNLGVPEDVAALTHRVAYNDAAALVAALDALPDQVAAVVMEPMTSQWPSPGYLEEVRRITHERGILLVFDEMLTGFRLAPGGAQQFFGVTPDLATFGKALANGLPLAALVGRRDVMELMSRVFFSGTYGGEALSLAAARVVLRRMATGQPTMVLRKIGLSLADRVNRVIDETGAGRYLHLSGHPAWMFLQWENLGEHLDAARTLFLQEMSASGVLILGTHTVSTAFTERDLVVVEDAYRRALHEVVEGMDHGDLLHRLRCAPIRPLFTVRT